MERIGLEKEMVEICKEIGRKIGFHAADAQQSSILYDLRRVKRFNAFLHVLERLKHKIPSLPTEQEFFVKIDPKNWLEYKSLISIFAKDQESSQLRKR